MRDTIVALSSGAPPSAIAVVRMSGPAAFDAARSIAGALPPLREARVRRLRHRNDTIDRALTLCFAAPDTATGEDLVEFHTHGSVAVVDAVVAALCTLPGVRRAEPGEFTRRSLQNGRIDLVQAEGLSALLAAETDAQRRAAMVAVDGLVRARLDEVERDILTIAARIEVALDFSDEEDGAQSDLDGIKNAIGALIGRLEHWQGQPTADALHRGFTVVLAGEPNAGKSSLLNRLAGREAAIVSDIAGTTRDRIEVRVRYAGLLFNLIDTAGLAERSVDPVELIGIDRAMSAIEAADVVLWLGDGPAIRADAILLHSRCDASDRCKRPSGRLPVSARTGEGLDQLWEAIVNQVRANVPASSALVLNNRQNRCLLDMTAILKRAQAGTEFVLIAHDVAAARNVLHQVTGRADVESMLDALFSGFCLGK